MKRDHVLHFLAMCVICMAAVLAFCSCGEDDPLQEPVGETEAEIEDAGADGPATADASKF